MIRPVEAVLLGIVEGVTEFLPVSSTGHLILASWWLGLQGEAVKTFEVTIQSGALAAVAWLYRGRLRSMAEGVRGRSPEGRRLIACLLIGVLPSIMAGLLWHRAIKAHLFAVAPVAAALAVGGVVMIAVDRWRVRRPAIRTALDQMTLAEAAVIGIAQGLALWPGTSRAMTTIVAALLLGFSAPAAAEYSFLLALPTLGAATLFDAARHLPLLRQEVGWLSLGLGFFSAAAVAALAITGFVRYVGHRGLAPFGWYRIAVATVLWCMVGLGRT